MTIPDDQKPRFQLYPPMMRSLPLRQPKPPDWREKISRPKLLITAMKDSAPWLTKPLILQIPSLNVTTTLFSWISQASGDAALSQAWDENWSKDVASWSTKLLWLKRLSQPPRCPSGDRCALTRAWVLMMMKTMGVPSTQSGLRTGDNELMMDAAHPQPWLGPE